jgi:hypothetical protein
MSRNIVQKDSGLVDSLPSAAGPTPENRARLYTFKVPQACRIGPSDPEQLTIRELTSDQQIEASRLGQGNQLKAGFELAKAALYAVDGKVVNHGDFESEIYWQRFSSKVRQLASIAFANVHNTSNEEDADFLRSRQSV